MDIVYILKGDSKELRYSLRSLKNIPHDKVFIAGGQPTGLDNVIRVPVAQTATKWENQKRNLIAACRNNELSDDFILFNDDFYVTRRVQNPPLFHRGLLSEVFKAYSSRSDPYAVGMKSTLKYMGPEALAYDAIHVPMVMNKDRVMGLIKNIPRGALIRSWYGNFYKIGGEFHEDAKIRIHAPYQELSDRDFVSTSNQSFKKDWPGKWIKNQFSSPSPYELIK